MIELIRTCSSVKGTFGVLVKDNEPVCDTVERPWVDNHNETSCIPVGIYEVIEYQSPTKGNVWLLKDVPSRNFIEIHPANYAHELKGCIAPGQGYFTAAGNPGVSNSKATMNFLKSTLPKTFTLTIRSI